MRQFTKLSKPASQAFLDAVRLFVAFLASPALTPHKLRRRCGSTSSQVTMFGRSALAMACVRPSLSGTR